MGLLTAVVHWFKHRDHDAEWRTWEDWLDQIPEALADIPTVRTERVPSAPPGVTPTLDIRWDPAALDCTYREAHRALLAGTPRVYLFLKADRLTMRPFMMQAHEIPLVGRALRQVLRQNRTTSFPGDRDSKES